MINNGKRYYIVDMKGHYYKINSKGDLVVASGPEEAAKFSLKEANLRIGSGRKSRFYSALEVHEVEVPDDELICDMTDDETIENPTIFDPLHNNWEDMLSTFCYINNHMDEYLNSLNRMLSDVDKEISDIMHYLEFNELNDEDMLKVSKMLQECSYRRREIKDEMKKTSLMKSNFFDSDFNTKVQQSLEFIEKMKSRQYTPRKLNELFQTQIYQTVTKEEQ